VASGRKTAAMRDDSHPCRELPLRDRARRCVTNPSSPAQNRADRTGWSKSRWMTTPWSRQGLRKAGGTCL